MVRIQVQVVHWKKQEWLQVWMPVALVSASLRQTRTEPIDVQQATALKLQLEAKASYELHPICRLVLPAACRPYLPDLLALMAQL